MDTVTIARESRAGDGIAYGAIKGLRSREDRALAFYRQCSGEITQMSDSIFRVPSFSQEGVEYVVDYERESCTCPAGTYRPYQVCKHVFVIGIHKAKRRARASSLSSARWRSWPPCSLG